MVFGCSIGDLMVHDVSTSPTCNKKHHTAIIRKAGDKGFELVRVRFENFLIAAPPGVQSVVRPNRKHTAATRSRT